MKTETEMTPEMAGVAAGLIQSALGMAEQCWGILSKAEGLGGAEEESHKRVFMAAFMRGVVSGHALLADGVVTKEVLGGALAYINQRADQVMQARREG